MRKVKLTKRFIDSLTAPTDKAQEFYRDLECKYLCLRITQSGLKSFVYEGTTDKYKHIRRVIGQYGALTLDQARIETIRLMQQFQQGVNPFEEVKVIKIESITLERAFEDYLAMRTLAESTVSEYRMSVDKYLNKWKKIDLNNISRAEVQQCHAAIKAHSPSQANKVMRVLRALYRFARFQYEFEGNPIVKHNPVDIISHTRAWAKVERKQSYIPSVKMKAFYEALEAFRMGKYYCKGSNNKEMIVDYILMLLFHGLRTGEAAAITRDAVSFEAMTLTLLADTTKAGRAAVLPLSDFSAGVLRRRIDALGDGDKYLFHSANELNNPLIAIRKPIKWISDYAGIPFTAHDLRRTYITAAEHLDISMYAIKMLVNHHLPGNDVTAGYIIMSPDRLRAANQQIADYLQRSMGLINDNVVLFKKA